MDGQAKATQSVRDEVVVVSSGSGSYEAQTESDAETLEDLETGFGLNPEQASQLRVCYKRRGIAYVEEKAELTRAQAWRRRWRLRRRARPSKRRWRASSARMSEVRGERTGAAVWNREENEGTGQGVLIVRLS